MTRTRADAVVFQKGKCIRGCLISRFIAGHYQVIAVRKVSKKRSEVSVEDDDFDPTATFVQSRNRQQTIDEGSKGKDDAKEDSDDDDFDPRA